MCYILFVAYFNVNGWFTDRPEDETNINGGDIVVELRDKNGNRPQFNLTCGRAMAE